MVPKESNVASVRSGNRFRETGHPSGNPVSSGRFAPESPAGFVRNTHLTESHTQINADLVCCRMTLEHIEAPVKLLSLMKRVRSEDGSTLFFFQVPDTERVLKESAFWDIYYEHCSYFSRPSLMKMFALQGFQEIGIWPSFSNQYLTAEARFADGTEQASVEMPSPESIIKGAKGFSVSSRHKIDNWRSWIREMKQAGKRILLWGGGSKAVAFLTTTKLTSEIDFVVDINPHRQGTYLAGGGQEIVPPEFLQEYQPDWVIVMNPIYQEEIESELAKLSPQSRTVTLD